MTLESPLRFLERPGLDETPGARLAYRVRPGAPGTPLVLWLGGFMSDMKGTKATALAAAAAEAGWGYLRFDYFAHGESSGTPREASITRWRDDTLAVIDTLTEGRPLLLVGSSMGGWMALLALKARPERIAGLVLIAPAPDFTQALMEPQLSETARAALARGEVYELPGDYGLPPFPLTQAFLDDGRRNAVLDGTIPCTGPVRILQGMQDPDVPWAHAVAVADTLDSPDLALTLIKQGDHRLSTRADLARLIAAIREIMKEERHG
jgi:pimeloyl-ACP methyl ester carboxylesterase